jgi:hypothetical protein
MVTSLRSKGAAGKAVRAGLALGGRISESIRNPSGSRRPIFNATLRAAAGWLFSALLSLRFNLDMLVARALKNSQLIRHLPIGVNLRRR